MKKLSAFILSAVLFSHALHAGEGSFIGRFHPGVEWGMSSSLATFHHYNYLDQSIGFRINDEAWAYPHQVNAFVFGVLSFDLNPHLDLSLLCGYQGVDRGRRTVPALMRLSYYLKEKKEDGLLFFTDAGMAVRNNEKDFRQYCLGTGYNIALTPHSSLVFRMCGRIAYDRPDVWDPIEEEYISARNIKRNDAWYYALNFSIGICF